MKTKTTSLCVLLALLLICASSASADIVMTLTDDGTNLTVSYSGTIDTASFPAPSGAGLGDFISPLEPQLRVVPSAGISVDSYAIPGGFSGAFGTGSGSISGFGFSGDPIGFNSSTLYLPQSHVSGPLSGSVMYPGTVASYGIFPTTVYPIGMSGQTITVTTVPEPATLTLFGIVFIGLALRRWKR